MKRLIRKCYEELKAKHEFTCGLEEKELKENYAMVFDYSNNSIVFDPKKTQEMYRKGRQRGAFNYDFPVFLQFCLTHELGHYYDYQENPDTFNYRSKDEYVQMELRVFGK